MACNQFFLCCLLLTSAAAAASVIKHEGGPQENALAGDNIDAIEDFGDKLITIVANEMQSFPDFDGVSTFMGQDQSDAIDPKMWGDLADENADTNYSSEKVTIDAFPDFSDYSMENTKENFDTGEIEYEDFPDFTG